MCMCVGCGGGGGLGGCGGASIAYLRDVRYTVDFSSSIFVVQSLDLLFCPFHVSVHIGAGVSKHIFFTCTCNIHSGAQRRPVRCTGYETCRIAISRSYLRC